MELAVTHASMRRKEAEKRGRLNRVLLVGLFRQAAFFPACLRSSSHVCQSRTTGVRLPPTSTTLIRKHILLPRRQTKRVITSSKRDDLTRPRTRKSMRCSVCRVRCVCGTYSPVLCRPLKRPSLRCRRCLAVPSAVCMAAVHCIVCACTTGLCCASSSLGT